MKFRIERKVPGSLARAGIIETPHGIIETPAFIPVATKATVKSLLPESVKDLVGADAILANTYHLYLQPGAEVLKKSGGLGKFMNWPGPTFTDSGGFQAFSLGPDEYKRKIATKKIGQVEVEPNEENQDRSFPYSAFDDDGVTFKSIIDGSSHRFTPEKSIEIQHDIGADIIFAFDECISPQESMERQEQAVLRTTRFAKRCLDRHKKVKSDQALFGIVQGGRHKVLRELSAKQIGGMSFDGFGIGGSFDKEDIGTAVGWVNKILPEDKPRHLLGIGEPLDLVLGIENGVDTFDCVAPTRLARNGSAYSYSGRLNLFNSAFISDFKPVNEDCNCYTCKNYSRAYLAHLFRAKEMLAATLLSIHNLYFVVNLVKKFRTAIIEDKFDEVRTLTRSSLSRG